MSTENHRGDFSEKSCNISDQESDVSKFYNGKSIFITGAAGFLGVVILESLLRCCPGIKKIFILLRPKNGMKSDDRKTEIFKREIFNKLKADNPDALNKVTVVPGDITQENLGMNERDLARITKEVSIVFHCAATVSFFKPLSFIMNQNVIGTDNIIDFCHKLVKLEVLVYTSTLYSNSNRTTEIDEKIYKMPFKAEYAVMLSRKGDIDGLNSLLSCFHPQFPNFYTFSKCVAENLLNEKAHDLPVCIVRPSVIICCTKGSMPGYIEDNSMMVVVSLGIGKGFIRVGPIYDDNMNVEVISGDVAANTHIVAAYLQATKSLSSPFIYNCTSGAIVTWKVWFSSLMNMVLKYPIPNSYLIPSVVLCRSPMMYKIYSFTYHYLPAFMIDIILWMIGSEFSLVKTYRFYERSLEKAKPFLTGQWKFECENFNSLPGKLNSRDAEVFCVDMKDFSLEKFTECLRAGCPFYRVNNKPYEEKLRNTLLRYFLTYSIRCFVLGSIFLVLYLTIFKRILVALEL